MTEFCDATYGPVLHPKDTVKSERRYSCECPVCKFMNIYAAVVVKRPLAFRIDRDRPRIIEEHEPLTVLTIVDQCDHNVGALIFDSVTDPDFIKLIVGFSEIGEADFVERALEEIESIRRSVTHGQERDQVPAH